jgi:uridine kinase
MNKKCLVVGISGPTTAGKTTISELIKDNFDCPIIHEDHFFNYERVFKELGGNREIPEAIDSPKFVEAVKKEIASGQHSLLLV